MSKYLRRKKNFFEECILLSYIDDPSRFQINQARAEEITLKEDIFNVPMPVDDDFGMFILVEDMFQTLLISRRC